MEIGGRYPAGRDLIVACVLGLAFWQLQPQTRAPAIAWFAQELMLRAWLRNGIDEPWPWQDAWPLARLTASDGAVDLIVLAGSSKATLDFGPGHLDASVLPGRIGNSVIAGQRDTHFRFLKDLAIGETLRVELTSGIAHEFEIIDLDVVDARSSSVLLDSDRRMLSLVTGFPFDAQAPRGSLRYVVTAKESR